MNAKISVDQKFKIGKSYNKGEWFLNLKYVWGMKDCMVEIKAAFLKADSAFGTGFHYYINKQGGVTLGLT